MRNIILALFLTSSLFAHKINLFITQDKNELQLYSYFASGAPCKECKIIIKNNNKIVLRSHLNKDGKFNYTSVYENLIITIDGSSGHLVEKKVKLTQIPKKNIDELKEEEQKYNSFKFFISLGFIVLFFYVLKWFKSRAK